MSVDGLGEGTSVIVLVGVVAGIHPGLVAAVGEGRVGLVVGVVLLGGVVGVVGGRDGVRLAELWTRACRRG